MKISVIVPVYNSSKFISRCLDSIIKQKKYIYEIICIDDGSTDDSLQKLNIYKQKYNFIKVLSKDNKGVSNTRNVGIKIASGDYVMFVDSDDYLEDDYLLKMLNNHNCEDIIKSGFTIDSDNSKIKCGVNKNKIIKMDEIVNNVKQNNNFNVVFGQLINLKLIKQNNIRFNEEISYGEDLLFNIECYKKSKQIKIVNNFGYIMSTDNQNSITRSVSIESVIKRIDDTIIVYQSLNELLNEKTINSIIIKKININLKKYIRSRNSSMYNLKKIIIKYRKQINKKTSLKSYDFKNRMLIFLLNHNFIRLYYCIIKIT